MSQAAEIDSAELLARIENAPFSRWHARARIIVGSATFFDAFDALSLAFAVGVMVGSSGIDSVFIMFAAAGIVGAVVATRMIETRARRLEEIAH